MTLNTFQAAVTSLECIQPITQKRAQTVAVVHSPFSTITTCISSYFFFLMHAGRITLSD
jgi:hypothetical protein